MLSSEMKQVKRKAWSCLHGLGKITDTDLDVLDGEGDKLLLGGR